MNITQLYSLQEDEYKVNQKSYKDIMGDVISLLIKNKEHPHLIRGHGDGDGACAITNMILVMEELNVPYSFEIINYDDFDGEWENKNEYCIYVDIGANASINNKNAIIIDHHQRLNNNCNRVAIDLNCNDYGIDGSIESCGSTMTYEIASLLGIKKALKIGAIGSTCDMQWKKYNEFVGRNKIFNSFNLKELKLVGDKIGNALHIDPEKTISYLINGLYSWEINHWYQEYQCKLESGIQDAYDSLKEYPIIFTCWIDAEHLGGKINTEICHRFNKPLVNFVEYDEKIRTSLRVGDSNPTHKWGEIFKYLKNNGVLDDGGGHNVACGGSLLHHQIDEFIHYLNDEEFINKFKI